VPTEGPGSPAQSVVHAVTVTVGLSQSPSTTGNFEQSFKKDAMERLETRVADRATQPAAADRAWGAIALSAPSRPLVRAILLELRRRNVSLLEALCELRLVPRGLEVPRSQHFL